MSFDKIKILWIEDQPDSGNPPRDLAEYAEIFEVNIDSSGQNDSIQSIKQYSELVELHHKGEGNNLFPVEIIAADYDLSKYNPSGNIVGKKDLSGMDPDSILSVIEEDNTQGKKEVTASKAPYKPSEHDGCIINVQYVTEFGKHPCGSVVTTYQSQEERHKTAKYLEDYLRRAWGVDISSNDGKARTWKNILETGVKALRKRIESLYMSGDIILSARDLDSLAQDPSNHQVLSITSSFATRRLPIKGLFIDIGGDQARHEAIKCWAKELYWHMASDSKTESDQNMWKAPNDFFKTVEEEGEVIWQAYCNTELLDKRRTLSRLLKKQKDGIKLEEFETESLRNLSGESEFDVNGNNCHKFIEIRSILDKVAKKGKSFCRPLCRWVAIYLIRRLLEQSLKLRYQMYGLNSPSAEVPSITASDLCLLLFPVPKNPVILPWDSLATVWDVGSGWGKALAKDLKNKEGDSYCLNLLHLLDGKGWDGKDSLGWKSFERGWIKENLIDFLIKEEYCLDETEAEQFLLSYPMTRRIISGNQVWGER